MAIYHFQVTLQGEGNTPEEAWNDAVEGFYCDPGEPEDHVLIEEDEDGNEIIETSDRTYSG